MIATDNPGSPNLAAQLLRLPPNFDLGGTLGVVQTFNRLAVTVKGTFDRNTSSPTAKRPATATATSINGRASCGSATSSTPA